MKVDRVWLDALVIGERHRQVDAAKVDALAESMKGLGLQQPISVWFDDSEAMHLVAGLHRVRAAEKLGWEQIDAITVTLDAIDRELWEIDENLMRSNLSAAQEAHHLARRKELWDARKAEQAKESGKSFPTAGGGAPGENKGFATDVAEKTGRTKRSVNQSISRAVIPPDVMNLIYQTPLDKGAYLDQVKKLPDVAAMREKVEHDLGNLRRKERSEALQQEAVERRKEAKEAKSRARVAACDLLLDALTPRDWDKLIGLLEQAGGTLHANDLREWQSPSNDSEAA